MMAPSRGVGLGDLGAHLLEHGCHRQATLRLGAVGVPRLAVALASYLVWGRTLGVVLERLRSRLPCLLLDSRDGDVATLERRPLGLGLDPSVVVVVGRSTCGMLCLPSWDERLDIPVELRRAVREVGAPVARASLGLVALGEHFY